jgi:hypothetical protein
MSDVKRKLTIHFGDIPYESSATYWYGIPANVRYFPESHSTGHMSYNYGPNFVAQIASELYNNQEVDQIYTASELLVKTIMLLNMKDESDSPREIEYVEHCFNQETKEQKRIVHGVNPVTRHIEYKDSGFGQYPNLLWTNSEINSEIYHLRLDKEYDQYKLLPTPEVLWIEDDEPEPDEEP